MDNFVLISHHDQTSQAPSDDENVRWLWAAPGTVGQLDRRLKAENKAKKELLYRGFNGGALLLAIPTDEDLVILQKNLDAYRVFAIPELFEQKLSPAAQYFITSKLVTKLTGKSVAEMLQWLTERLYGGQTGIKLYTNAIEVAPTYHGMINYQGGTGVEIEDDFGSQFVPMFTWRWNMYVDPHRTLEYWSEYEKDAGIEVKLGIRQNVGYEDHPVTVFSEDELKQSVRISGIPGQSQMSATLYIKGRGKIKVGPLHYRWSRLGLGEFFPGGERIVDANRQEIDVYFNPGDLTPPLNIYFSGYRMAEGFEGFYMMRSFKKPFMLIADPRVEGGGFYVGSEELEERLIQKIYEKLDWLGFDHSQIITSGMSMGTFGAMYYGAQLGAHAIILSKPLASIGNIALNEGRQRFGGFPTSLDVLQANGPDQDPQHDGMTKAKAMNQKFWDVIDHADLTKTQFAVGYMEQDDYDTTAFRDLMRHIRQSHQRVHVISKSYLGHHGDMSAQLTSWFKQQYRTILREDF